MYWANFLHIYQPPTQKPMWVKRVSEESYRKIIKELKKSPEVRTTLNINGVLLELLEKNECRDVIEGIKFLAKRGQLELTGSAKYHAFLPKLPEEEIVRQISLNEEVMRKYFGALWQKKGFFPPEMAYSRRVAEIAKKLGYKWIIIDEIAFPKAAGENVRLYSIKGLGDFFAFFRNRSFSFSILSAQLKTISSLVKKLKEEFSEGAYLLTAMDGETFGHHRPGLERIFSEIASYPELKTVTISELFNFFKEKEEVEPRDSTWSLMPKDLAKNIPFARWDNPDNEIHQMQWRLTKLAVDSVRKSPANKKSRDLLNRALHSDQYWWASARPWWSLEMVERGAKELEEAVNISEASAEDKKLAHDLYSKIVFTGFDWQRSGKVDELARQEDEEMRARLDEKGKFFLNREEYREIIAGLRREMLEAAKGQEYGRAGMIKERIKELETEMRKAKA